MLLNILWFTIWFEIVFYEIAGKPLTYRVSVSDLFRVPRRSRKAIVLAPNFSPILSDCRPIDL